MVKTSLSDRLVQRRVCSGRLDASTHEKHRPVWGGGAMHHVFPLSRRHANTQNWTALYREPTDQHSNVSVLAEKGRAAFLLSAGSNESSQRAIFGHGSETSSRYACSLKKWKERTDVGALTYS